MNTHFPRGNAYRLYLWLSMCLPVFPNNHFVVHRRQYTSNFMHPPAFAICTTLHESDLLALRVRGVQATDQIPCRGGVRGRAQAERNQFCMW